MKYFCGLLMMFIWYHCKLTIETFCCRCYLRKYGANWTAFLSTASKTLYLWLRNWPLLAKCHWIIFCTCKKVSHIFLKVTLKENSVKEMFLKASRENLGNSNANIFPQIVSHGAAKWMVTAQSSCWFFHFQPKM